MATVKALTDFHFKGKQIKKGDDVVMPIHAVESYERIDYVKATNEVKKKVRARVERKVQAGLKAEKRSSSPAQSESKRPPGSKPLTDIAEPL